jgi:soluble lytic murein transglycosylase
MKRRARLLIVPFAALFVCAVCPAAPSCELEARALRTKFTPQTRTQVEQCISRNGESAPSAAARLALGVTSIEGKNHAAALAFLDKAAKPLAPISDYIAFFKAQALAGLDRHADALAAIEPVWRQPGGSPITGRAALLAAKSAQTLGRPEQALRLLKSQEAYLPQPQGDMAIAEASKSGDDYARVYFRYPSSAEAALAAVQWKSLGSPAATPENYLMRIDKASGAQAAALRVELAQAAANWTAAQRELALVRTWAIDHRARRYAAARTGLTALTLTTPEADAERTGLLYDTARRLNLDADRNAAFRRLAMNHAGSRAYLDALLAEADRHLRENEFAEYEPLYKTCADKYDRDEKAPFCHWKVVWSSYLRRRAGAEALLREHLQRFPHSEKANAALYFLGRIEEKRRHGAAARAYFDAAASRFPNTYYALISVERAGSLPQADAGTTQWIANIRWPQRSPLPSNEPPAAQTRRERAMLLRMAGLDNYVEQELRHGAREFPSPIRLATDLAEFMTSIGQADKGLRYVKNLLPGYLYFPWDPAGEKFWRHAFPLPFQDDLQKYARENNVDPFVVAGLIRQESEFNPKVISYANAYGLTQILPSTGRELSRRVGMKNFMTPMLFDPAVNLRLGTFYIKTMLASFNGRWEDVLAGYNAGPSRAIKWRRWATYEEQAEFIETVPFDQTRDYIQSVLRNAAVYKKLYARDLALIKSTNEPKPVVAAVKPKPVSKRAHR